MSQVPDQSAECISFGNGEKDCFSCMLKNILFVTGKTEKGNVAYVLHTL